MSEQQATAEFTKATRIAKAIQAKFPKHTQYVREIKTGDFVFIEIALRPLNGSQADEVTTAYSAGFFSEITEDNIKERALKILKDFRILMGQPS